MLSLCAEEPKADVDHLTFSEESFIEFSSLVGKGSEIRTNPFTLEIHFALQVYTGCI